MLAVDYYEKIGELVARVVLNECYVSIHTFEEKIKVYIIAPDGVHEGGAEILWVSKTGALNATIEALEEALEGL